MTDNNFSEIARKIWSVADLLRGDFKQSQYGRIILPFTLLRRLECVLDKKKKAILDQKKIFQDNNFAEVVQEQFLLEISEWSFFNTSQFTLASIGQTNIQENLINYIEGFSKNAHEIFKLFNFKESIKLLSDANLLFKVIESFATIDLSLEEVSNHTMGLAFEELIRKFAESSNETAGEHFTPRDIVHLTTALVFEANDTLNKEGVICNIYDPTAGTGGFLSSGMEYLHKLNPHASMRAYGQELNPESYAICKADMLIKGQDVDLIKLGNTLSDDQLKFVDNNSDLPDNERELRKFDYMLSNPPFGVDWKKIEETIKDEHEKGIDGRFGAGLPRVSDGSLLFLMHLISKLSDEGGRIGIILNGSPLFTGSAGSGESEIRRHILEKDLLEAIIALPNDMFYNTGIATYVWVLSNNKKEARKGKVQLINATNLSSKMRKSLGSKRNYLTDAEIETIIQNYSDFKAVDILADDGEGDTQKPFSSKIFNTHEFGYRRVTIERPLRLSACISNDAIEKLRFSSSKNLNEIMQAVYAQFGAQWTDENYGDLSTVEADVRSLIKAEFTNLKEPELKKQIKAVLNVTTWKTQITLMEKAKALQGVIGTTQHDDFNTFEPIFKNVLKKVTPELDTKDKKQILDAITWINPEAEPVISKIIKGKDVKANPLYGSFNYKGQVVEFSQDGNLRDAENIALNPSIDTTQMVEDYFKKEVQPHVADAWINATKCDDIDGEIGIVGYEIPFNRHFYVYQPPRDLAEIDADLDAVTQEIMQLLQEVHV